MKIVVSTSCKYVDELMPLKKYLDSSGIVSHFPKMDEAAQTDPLVMKNIILTFFSAVDDCDLVYVYSPNGVIGASVANEIGYAFAKSKTIFSSAELSDYGIRPMVDSIKSVEELKNYIKEYKDV